MAFNNHEGSTKSYDYVREHNESVNRLDVILPRAPISAAYEPGHVEEVVQHDGSVLRLRKVAADYDAERSDLGHELTCSSMTPRVRL